MLLWLLLTGVLSFYLLWNWIRGRKLPPGPLNLPIIGSLLCLDSKQPYISLTELSRIYGKIYGLYLGSVYTVVLSDDLLIRDALKNDKFTGRAPLYVTHGIMGGYGLICSAGELWKDQRKLSISWLKNMGMIKFGITRSSLEKRILNGIDSCVDLIDEQLNTKNEINPMSILHHTLGNIMNDLVFGVIYDKGDETWHYLQELQEEGVKHIGVSGVVNFIPWLRYLPSNRKIIKYLLEGKSKTHKIYDEIIKKIEKKILMGSDCDDSTTIMAETTNITELFLRERLKREKEIDKIKYEFCNNEQLRHLLADLFGAGVDTTLTTLRWFLLFIANNPNVQNKIQQEMLDNKIDSLISICDQQDKLPYLKACIAETQRIRSVVPIGIPHGTTTDLTFDGYFIPKNTMVIPLQWAVHMNPIEWPEPDKFSPERFINSSGSFFTPSSFIPFQTGKRMCLGEELAKMLLFGYCCKILLNFELFGSNDTDISYGDCGITLTPPQYSILFKKRTK